jgi:hypothetical protein
MRVSSFVRVVALALVAAVGALTPGAAWAQGNSSNNGNAGLRAVPFVFIGNDGDCGAGTFGSHIVTSAWLGGMGLPDTDDTALNGVAATKNDPHRGLLLSKNGPTTDCSAAGARIVGAQNATVDTTTALGFDYRNGGHCGAGAPRFNLTVKPPTGPNTFHFVGGCANGTQTPAPQDPTQWTRARFVLTDPAQAFPPVPAGSTIVSLTVIFDEGTDSTSTQDPNGVGLAVIDNIFVNNTFIRTGNGVADGTSGEVKNQRDDEDRNNQDNGAGNDANGGNNGLGVGRQ